MFTLGAFGVHSISGSRVSRINKHTFLEIYDAKTSILSYYALGLPQINPKQTQWTLAIFKILVYKFHSFTFFSTSYFECSI